MQPIRSSCEHSRLEPLCHTKESEWSAAQNEQARLVKFRNREVSILGIMDGTIHKQSLLTADLLWKRQSKKRWTGSKCES